jgi:hypothetical protein
MFQEAVASGDGLRSLLTQLLDSDVPTDLRDQNLKDFKGHCRKVKPYAKLLVCLYSIILTVIYYILVALF